MSDWVIDLGLKILSKMITEILSAFIDKFSEMLNDIFIVSERIVQGDFVSKITDYTFRLSIAILTFQAIAQLIKLYILPEDGDPEMDYGGFFVRLGKSAVLISFSTIICTMFIKFADYLASDILGLISGKVELVPVLKNSMGSLAGLSFGNMFVEVIIILAVIICLLIISVQAGLRGVNLAILQMTAPIFMSNYLTTDKNLFNKWVQNMFSVSLTYVMQIVLTTIGLKFVANGFENPISVFIGICWLVVTIQSPKLLKEFAYSTGVKGGVGGATRIGTSVLQIAKFMR